MLIALPINDIDDNVGEWENNSRNPIYFADRIQCLFRVTNGSGHTSVTKLERVFFLLALDP